MSLLVPGTFFSRNDTLSESRMPRCPNCSKNFKDDASVAMHMSQPASGCNTWVNDLVHLHQELNPPIPAARNHTMQEPSQSTADMVGPSSAEDIRSFDLDEMDIDTGDGHNDVTKEYFLGAAQTFGKGMSFVDRFNADRFSAYRQQNLYYPFVSSHEWKLGQWLLRSGLSMSAIDDFLSLELVSHCLASAPHQLNMTL